MVVLVKEKEAQYLVPSAIQMASLVIIYNDTEYTVIKDRKSGEIYSGPIDEMALVVSEFI